jgi:hypothetical protein
LKSFHLLDAPSIPPTTNFSINSHLHSSSPTHQSKAHYHHRFFPLFSYVNPAFSIRNEHSDDSNSSSDENSDFEPREEEKPQTTTKTKQIDLSPEALQKRKEVYNKWLQSTK